jgi:hypothetical protein
MSNYKPGDKRILQGVLIGTTVGGTSATTVLTHGITGRVKVTLMNFNWRALGGTTAAVALMRVDIGQNEFQAESTGIITSLNGQGGFVTGGGIQMYQTNCGFYLPQTTSISTITNNFSPIYWVGRLASPTLSFAVCDATLPPGTFTGQSGFSSDGFGIAFFTLSIEYLGE